MELLSSSFALDAVDLKILDQLQTDASQSNQALAERVHVSPPTCLRRVKRLLDAGLIERQIAILSADKLKPLIGHGLTAIVEVTLTEQNDEALQAFEARISPEPAVQQCYRVSSGPDFILIVQVRDMGDYLALVQRVFTSDAKVRNVKAFFSVLRSKFEPRLSLK
jgi:Lrp/AsnC family transcriptional regulator, leucine-responsive regulatory protein